MPPEVFQSTMAAVTSRVILPGLSIEREKRCSFSAALLSAFIHHDLHMISTDLVSFIDFSTSCIGEACKAKVWLPHKAGIVPSHLEPMMAFDMN